MDRRHKRVLLWSFGIALAAIILTIITFFLFIDTRVVSEKLQQEVSNKIGGNVTFRDIDFSLFPLPHAVIHQVRLSVPGKAEGTIKSLRLYPKLFLLITGEVQPFRMYADSPDFIVSLPDEKLEDISYSRAIEKIKSFLDSLSVKIPALDVALDNGLLTLKKGGNSIFIFQDVHVDADIKKGKLKANINGSHASFIINRRDIRQEIAGENIEVTLSVEDDKTMVMLKQLNLKNPHISLSGKLFMDNRSPNITLDLEGKGIDVHSIRNAAYAVIGDVPIIQDIFTILRGGMVPSIHFSTSGRSFKDLGRTENIFIKGQLSNGDIFVPGLSLKIADVNGKAMISKGILEGSNISCSVDNARGAEGTIRVGLKGKDAPFHLITKVSMNLVELPPLLRRFVKKETLMREIDQITDIKGKIEGKLILGDRLDNVHSSVHIPDLKFSVRYRYLPDFVEVSGVEFRYDESGIYISNLNGRTGSTSFHRLTAQISLLQPYHLEISSGMIALTTEEIYPLLLSFKPLKEILTDLKSVKGFISISDMKLRGPLTKPDQWDFNFKGKAEDLIVESSFTPFPIRVKFGEFQASPKQLSFSRMQTTFSDASLHTSGTLQNYLKDIDMADITFYGSIGVNAKQWITKFIHFPQKLDFYAPLSVSQGNLVWHKNKSILFQGILQMNKGTEISLNVISAPGEFVIQNSRIRDADSDAAIDIRLSGNDLKFGFKGELKQATLDNIFIDPLFNHEWIQGDFRAEGQIDTLARFRVQGNLKGGHIYIPWEKTVPLVIENISLTTLDRTLKIESSNFMLGGSRLKLRGDLDFRDNNVIVDADLSGDRIDWITVSKIFEPEIEKGQRFPLQGTVRLRLDEANYKQFMLNPMHADITLTGDETRAEILESRLCGISASGHVYFKQQDVKLDIDMEAQRQELKPTVACLSEQRVDITGQIDFKGHFEAQGKRNDFLNIVHGDFEMTAKNGYISRERNLDKTFDLLNGTETFKGEFPDLDKKALDYRSIQIKGNLRKGKLEIEEGLLDTSVTEVVMRGNIDLNTSTVDLNALVAPIKVSRRLSSKIPVLGQIAPGNLVSVPVKITGPVEDAKVTFFSPSAVGEELLGIFKRTFKMPVTLVEPLLPGEEKH